MNPFRILIAFLAVIVGAIASTVILVVCVVCSVLIPDDATDSADDPFGL